MQKLRKDPDRSNNLDGKESARRLYGGPREAKATGSAAEPLPEYDDLFGPPALSNEAEARRAAERYRDELRQAFGKGVPENEVDDFKEGFLNGCKHPDAGESYLTAFRAGQRWKQRQCLDARRRASARKRERTHERPKGLIPTFVSRYPNSNETLSADCLMTFDDVAGRLGLSVDEVHLLIHRDELETYEHDGSVWIHPQHLAEYESRKAAATAGGGSR